jgi:hypothetical protein
MNKELARNLTLKNFYFLSIFINFRGIDYRNSAIDTD